MIPMCSIILNVVEVSYVSDWQWHHGEIWYSGCHCCLRLFLSEPYFAFNNSYFFSISLPQKEKEERNNFLNNVFCKWWLPLVWDGRLEKDSCNIVLSTFCKLKKNKKRINNKCQNSLKNSLRTERCDPEKSILSTSTPFLYTRMAGTLFAVTWAETP